MMEPRSGPTLPNCSRPLDSDAACPGCGGRSWEHFCKAFDRYRGVRETVWEVGVCPACGHGRTLPPLSGAELAAHYSDSYLGDTGKALDDYLSGRLAGSRSWRHETDKVRLVEEFVQSGTILDVGCGEGKFLWALDPTRWDRRGVEFLASTVELVRARIPDIAIAVGDIFNPALPAGSFDVVTFWHVLEHLPDPSAALRRACALLRAGGCAVVSLPRMGSLQSALFRGHWYAFDDVPRHQHHFSARSLRGSMERGGFRVLSQRFFSPSLSFHCLKHSLLNWSCDRFGTRIPYYVIKPALFLFPPLERVSGRYGYITAVGEKPYDR